MQTSEKGGRTARPGNRQDLCADFHALNDISLTIGRGEFLTLLGPRLRQDDLPDDPRRLRHRAARDAAARTASTSPTLGRKRAFGMVPRATRCSRISVEKNIAFPLQVQAGNERAADPGPGRRDIDGRVGLRGHEKKLPSADLSGGQQQRVALARALVFEPVGAAARRAVLGARQEPARLDAGGGPAPAPGDRHDLRLRHPRPVRGAGAVDPRWRSSTTASCSRSAAPATSTSARPTASWPSSCGEINILPLSRTATRRGDPPTAGSSSVIRASPVPRACRPAISRSAPSTWRSDRASRRRVATRWPRTIEDVTYLGAATRFALKTPGGTGWCSKCRPRRNGPDLDQGNCVWASWERGSGLFPLMPERRPLKRDWE